MNRKHWMTLLFALSASPAAWSQSTMTCDVIVAGGTTAALSAALTSAREGVSTCLIEPTDWAGGQLTAGGVPAVDFAWHSVGSYRVGDVAKLPANLPSEFVTWMNRVGNTGNCSVSKNCFNPRVLLANSINPAIADQPNLQVLYNSVVKRVSKAGSKINSVTVIKRTPQPGVLNGGYGLNLSQDMPDWYSPVASARYTKQTIQISSNRPAGPMVIDATELGDVMVLSDAAYLQGVEPMDGSIYSSGDTCGQAMVFPFTMRLNAAPVADNMPPVGPPSHPEFYAFGVYNWDQIWRYRRLIGTGTLPAAGEVSLQNWNPGNDYAYGYMFKGKKAKAQEVADWYGGVDYFQIAEAEKHAYGWYQWYAQRQPQGLRNRINLASEFMGTGHGLSKFPYMRDIPRSIGLNNFVFKASDMSGGPDGKTGIAFADRVAIGSYNVDIHPLKTCTLPAYMYAEVRALPFYIPYRMLTNRDVPNLLVAGKTMAQSFLANSALRLQPIEFSSGIGAGAAAAVLIKNGAADTQWGLNNLGLIQSVVKKYAPIDWTVNGVVYPQVANQVSPVDTTQSFCPPGSQADRVLGFCVDEKVGNAYGPFTKKMTDDCTRFGGGPACFETMRFVIDGRSVNVPRWSLSFAVNLRGSGTCMNGSLRDSKYPNFCVEESSQSRSGVREVYGPFPATLISRCLAGRGGDACYSNRWSYTYFDGMMR